MNKLKAKLKAMERARDKYDAVLGDLQYFLRPFVEFDFSVQWLPGDGHCILNNDTADVAPVEWCLEEIRTNRILTEDSHKDYCI